MKAWSSAGAAGHTLTGGDAADPVQFSVFVAVSPRTSIEQLGPLSQVDIYQNIKSLRSQASLKTK